MSKKGQKMTKNIDLVNSSCSIFLRILRLFERKFAIFRCGSVAALVPVDIATVTMLSRNTEDPQVVSDSDLDCVTKSCCCCGSLAFPNSSTTECNCKKNVSAHPVLADRHEFIFSSATCSTTTTSAWTPCSWPPWWATPSGDSSTSTSPPWGGTGT